LVVSLHLALALVFFAMYAFTLRGLKLKHVACLKGCRMHTVAQIMLVSISSIASFMVFGMRPDIGVVDLYRENEEDQENMKFFLEMTLFVISFLWGICYVLQGFHARTNYEEERMIGEVRGTEERSDERWPERNESKSTTPPSYITNNLPLVAPLLF